MMISFLFLLIPQKTQGTFGKESCALTEAWHGVNATCEQQWLMLPLLGERLLREGAALSLRSFTEELNY